MRLNAQFSIAIKTIRQIDSVVSNAPLGTISASYTIDWLSITIGMPAGCSISFEELAYKNYPLPDMDNNIALNN